MKMDRRKMKLGVRTDKRTDIAWCAGFFDGEGYVGTHGGSKREPDSKYLSASVNQKGRVLLERFQTIIGFGTIGKENSKGMSALYFTSSADVIKLYEFLAPYLGPVKTAQFENAFKSWFDYRKKKGRIK